MLFQINVTTKSFEIYFMLDEFLKTVYFYNLWLQENFKTHFHIKLNKLLTLFF